MSQRYRPRRYKSIVMAELSERALEEHMGRAIDAALRERERREEREQGLARREEPHETKATPKA